MINGNAIIRPGKPALTDAQIACVELCRETLAQALEGKINSIGIIVCLDGGFASVMAGYQAADLNLGCDDLKAKVLQAVTTGNVRKSGSVLRVK